MFQARILACNGGMGSRFGPFSPQLVEKLALTARESFVCDLRHIAA
jgi:hypothetical protein